MPPHLGHLTIPPPASSSTWNSREHCGHAKRIMSHPFDARTLATLAMLVLSDDWGDDRAYCYSERTDTDKEAQYPNLYFMVVFLTFDYAV